MLPYLRANTPDSLKLLGTLADSESGFTFRSVVDDASSAIVAVHALKNDGGKWKLTLHASNEKAAARAMSEALKVVVAQTPSTDAATTKVTLASVDRALLPSIVAAAELSGFGQAWVEPCRLWIAPASSPAATLPTLPGHDTRLVQLRAEVHAETVNDAWKYRSETSLAMVRRCMASPETQPCYGIEVRCNDGGDDAWTLASWCLTYSYGAIGMLATSQRYRRRGFARAAVKAVSHALKKSKGAERFTYIVETNAASERLFRQLGWAPTGKESFADWVGFKPMERKKKDEKKQRS